MRMLTQNLHKKKKNLELWTMKMTLICFFRYNYEKSQTGNL